MPGPNFLSQAELDDLRAQQADIISETGTTGTIKRQTWASDNNGGATQTLTTIAINVPMRHWISSGPNGTSEESRFWGEQELAQTDAFIVMAWDQSIAINDVIETMGRTWKVVGMQFDDALLTAKRLRVESIR